MLAQKMSLDFEEEVVVRLVGYHVRGPSIPVRFPSFIFPFYAPEANGLRQHNLALGLPVRKAKGGCRLNLPFGYGLQATANDFGHVGSGKKSDASQHTDQHVNRKTLRHEQREHERGHEQNRDQRHSANQLHVDRAQTADSGHT